MSVGKQKMSQLVLKKIRQKKQAQQRNRPHFQLLRLDVQFQLQSHTGLKQEISSIEKATLQEKQTLQRLKQQLQELENTGKKKTPVITIKPEFIASEKVSAIYKDFYRKTANSYLRSDIIRKQKHQIYLEKQKQIINKMNKIETVQKEKQIQFQRTSKILRQKRYKVLQQDVRRRKLIEEQQRIEMCMEKIRQENNELLKEYQIKKVNLQSRIAYSQELVRKIQNKRRQIEAKYNPASYRDYLKSVFDIRLRNQFMQKNLVQVIRQLDQSKNLSEKYRKQLENKSKVSFLGKTLDSPSKLKANLHRRNTQRARTQPKNLSQMFHNKFSPKVSRKVSKFRASEQEQVMSLASTIRSTCSRGKSTTKKNYSSLKTLKSHAKTPLKTDRTMETNIGTFSRSKPLNFSK